MVLNEKPLWSYDDLLLEPQWSDVSSRSAVDLSMNVGSKLHLKLPLIAANMDTICGPLMSITMDKLGGLGILHRFGTITSRIHDVVEVKDAGCKHIATSIGVGEAEVSAADWMVRAGANVICLDIAHANSKAATNTLAGLQHLREKGVVIIAGNVCTPGAAATLAAYCDIIKIGVGPGAACSTRTVTGHGVPQGYAVHSIATWGEESGLTNKWNSRSIGFIADGGLKNAGDCTKAFGLGAHAVMIGSLFAGTTETPGPILYDKNFDSVKEYRGMASVGAQVARGSSQVRTPEGISKLVPAKGSVANVVEELAGGIRSGCSYSGVHSLGELHKHAVFNLVTPATHLETGTR